MIKLILKKVLPLPLLHKVQLQLNELRIATVDNILFPEQPIPKENFLIQRDEYPFRLYPVASSHLPPPLHKQFGIINVNWTQDEYLLIYDKPCVIEPNFGWALSIDKKLIYPSLGFSRAPYLKKPSLKIKVVEYNSREEYEELISLRDTGEENYYHFYNDVLAKLFFLEEKLGVRLDVPILISKKLYDKRFFKYFLAHPYLSQRKWIVQDNQYIHSKRTYFCKPLTHTPHYYQRILEMVHIEDQVATGDAEHRLFITRNPKRLRFIENNAEAEAVCREFGFEAIDFDELSLPQQIRLMRQTRYIVAIHGAGLMNMLFRGQQPLGLLEIFPPTEYLPFHYVLMATQMHYQYDGLIGQPGTKPFSGGFRVDLDELRCHLSSLVKS